MNFNGYIILYGKHKKFHEHEITIIAKVNANTKK